MKYIDGFRDRETALFLRNRMTGAAERLAADGRTARVMEVCGSHTMAIARYGVRDLLPPAVDLISGPGCPVCVTDTGYIDAAIELARRGVVVATFGDLMRVPGSRETLARVRAEGAHVPVCYSPAAALEIAKREPENEVVFLAIGFETTVAPVISIVDAARRDGVRNISLLTAFKLVPPALRALLDDPAIRVDAFLCPAHVSAIIGADAYRPFVEDDRVPCVVAGFEPLDILLGIAEIVEQFAAGEARLVNQYSRVVKPEGNRKALNLMKRLLEPVDAAWRGIGVIPGSGLGLRAEVAEFDAAKRFGLVIDAGKTNPACKCGDVLKGVIRPRECPLFGGVCHPDNPIGPCMVSSEGSCAAAFKYSRCA
ncbi:MAG: hydrogenase formation protein HypD [Deltaproteobacteria bacterium]|nr:hydrogenase formation protein HypD [Deltaproteobacteria bacterium]